VVLARFFVFTSASLCTSGVVFIVFGLFFWTFFRFFYFGVGVVFGVVFPPPQSSEKQGGKGVSLFFSLSFFIWISLFFSFYLNDFLIQK